MGVTYFDCFLVVLLLQGVDYGVKKLWEKNNVGVCLNFLNFFPLDCDYRNFPPLFVFSTCFYVSYLLYVFRDHFLLIGFRKVFELGCGVGDVLSGC